MLTKPPENTIQIDSAVQVDSSSSGLANVKKLFNKILKSSLEIKLILITSIISLLTIGYISVTTLTHLGAKAAENSVILRFDQGQISLTPSQSKQVKLMADIPNSNKLTAVEVVLSYDPRLIQSVAIAPSNSLISLSPQTVVSTSTEKNVVKRSLVIQCAQTCSTLTGIQEIALVTIISQPSQTGSTQVALDPSTYVAVVSVDSNGLNSTPATVTIAITDGNPPSSATPAPTGTPTPSSTPIPTTTATPTPSATATPTPTPSATPTSTPTPTAQPEGARIYWNFNEGSGSSANAQGTNPVTLKLSDAKWSSGKSGSALQLSGSAYGNISSSSINSMFGTKNGNTGDFTLIGWIKLNKLGHRHPIITKQGNEKRGFLFSIEENNKLLMQFYKNQTSKTEVQSSKTLDTQWHNVAVTYDYVSDGKSVIKLYIDGELAAETNKAVGPLASNSQTFDVGRYYWSDSYNRYFDGLIDEVYVFNRALNQSEVKDVAF